MEASLSQSFLTNLESCSVPLLLAFDPIPWQDVTHMAIFWSILVLSVIVTNLADVAMKIQVNERLPSEEKFSWWNRDSWRVARKYRDFYPNSYLPLISQCTFWLFVVLLSAGIVGTLRKPN
jgi:hypothetical protein